MNRFLDCEPLITEENIVVIKRIRAALRTLQRKKRRKWIFLLEKVIRGNFNQFKKSMFCRLKIMVQGIMQIEVLRELLTRF